MKNPHRNLRKAAVLVASLDGDRAEAMLAQMTPEQAQAVRKAVERLGPVEPAEQREVIEEFFRIGPLVPNREPSGIELSELRCADITVSPDDGEHADQRIAASNVLQEAPVEALVSFLQHERPQTIAVVVSRLASRSAAEVLAALPSETQVDVARRIVELDDADPAVLAAIEEGLKSWLEERVRADRRREAGMTALAGILDEANADTRANILGKLEHRPAETAACEAPPRPPEIQFADLAQFDSASLRLVLNRAGVELLVLALAGARCEFAERALGLMTPAKADAVRRGLAGFGPTRLSDIEAAQHELALVAAQLEIDGEIAQPATRHLSVAV